jgi:hypothetical protein
MPQLLFRDNVEYQKEEAVETVKAMKSPPRVSRTSSHARSINSARSVNSSMTEENDNQTGYGNVTLPPHSPRSPRSPNHPVDYSHLAKPADSFDYIETKDILPLKHPSKEFNNAIKDLEKQDWPEVFNTLNIIRSAVLHHSVIVLKSNLLHSIILQLIKQVENLRSSLSKNALLTITDCFIGLGKNIDHEILSIFPCLLKRAADSSIFLSESADRAIEKMIENISTHRSLLVLLNGLDHRTSMQRSKAAYFLLLLTKMKGFEYPSLKEFDLLKSKLLKLLQDQAQETRSFGREIIKELLSNHVVSREELEHYSITSSQIDKIYQDSSTGDGYGYESGEEVDGKARLKSSLRGRGGPLSLRTPPSNTRKGLNDNDLFVESPVPASTNRKKKANLPHTAISVDSLNSDNGSVDSHYLEFGIATQVRMTPRDGSIMDDDIQCFSPNPVLRRPPQAKTPLRSPRSNSLKPTAGHTAKRIMESDAELMQWQTTIMTISTSKNWNEKKDALSFMTNLILNHFSVLRDCGKLESSFDIILEKFSDGSSKIVLHSMDLFDKILQNHSILLQCNVLQVVVPKMLNAVSSSNK